MNKGWIFKLLLTTIIWGIAFAAETALCTRVAVIDFESIGDAPDVGRAVTEIVRTELIKTGKYEVVERALLNKILEEQKFQLSDLVDASKAVELGKMLGADLILTGSVVKIGSSYTINARFIDVKTGAAKKAEAIRGYDIDELTYMSIKLIGIMEQEVEPAPIAPPRPVTPPEERPHVPVPPKIEVMVSPRNYISVSLGGAAFSMEDLNDGIKLVFAGNIDPIESGPDIEISFGRTFTENFGIGLALGYLGGSTSGKLYSYDAWGNIVQMSEDLEVSGVLFSFRPFFRQSLSDKVALALEGDIGGISLDYSESTGAMGKTEGSGSGALLGIFASGQYFIQNFFLQADIGFRSAKGDVDLDTGGTLELDFSGPYLLLTGGIKF